jgi:hypothetical protein
VLQPLFFRDSLLNEVTEIARMLHALKKKVVELATVA